MIWYISLAGDSECRSSNLTKPEICESVWPVARVHILRPLSSAWGWLRRASTWRRPSSTPATSWWATKCARSWTWRWCRRRDTRRRRRTTETSTATERPRRTSADISGFAAATSWGRSRLPWLLSAAPLWLSTFVSATLISVSFLPSRRRRRRQRHHSASHFPFFSLFVFHFETEQVCLFSQQFEFCRAPLRSTTTTRTTRSPTTSTPSESESGHDVTLDNNAPEVFERRRPQRSFEADPFNWVHPPSYHV